MALGSFFENEAGGGPAEVEMGDEAGAAVAAGAAAPTDPPATAAEPPKPSPARPAGRGNIFLESDDDDSDSDMVILIHLIVKDKFLIYFRIVVFLPICFRRAPIIISGIYGIKLTVKRCHFWYTSLLWPP